MYRLGPLHTAAESTAAAAAAQSATASKLAAAALAAAAKSAARREGLDADDAGKKVGMIHSRTKKNININTVCIITRADSQ